jgi:hypothetical protein
VTEYLKPSLLWDIKWRKLVVSHGRFGIFPSHLQGSSSPKLLSWTVRPLKTVWLSGHDMSALKSQANPFNIREERRLPMPRGRSLQFRKTLLLQSDLAEVNNTDFVTYL